MLHIMSIKKNILFILIVKYWEDKIKQKFPKPILKHIICFYMFIESYEILEELGGYKLQKHVMLSKGMDEINKIKTLIKKHPNLISIMLDFDGCFLDIIDVQSVDQCIKAVSKNPYALEYVKKQTPIICLKAVTNNGIALCYVKDQSYEICLEAVKNNGLALRYVKDQSYEICFEAIKNNRKALKYIKK